MNVFIPSMVCCHKTDELMGKIGAKTGQISESPLLHIALQTPQLITCQPQDKIFRDRQMDG